MMSTDPTWTRECFDIGLILIAMSLATGLVWGVGHFLFRKWR